MTAAAMTAPSDGISRSVSGRAWLVIFLLFLIQVTNFADKAVISLAANDIMAEFGLDTKQYGLIAGAFFSLFTVSGLFVAVFITPRFPPREIMAVLLLIWSLVQLPIVFAASFTTIILCRTLLGMGEGAGTPTAMNAAHEWFDDKSRNIPTALIVFGAATGSMVAPPILTAVMQAYEWRAAFLACSGFGACVLVLWLLFSRSGPYAAATASRNQPAPPSPPGLAKRLWREPTLWGVAIVGTASYWVTGFQVSWLAPYLIGLARDPIRAAWFLSAIFACQTTCILAISMLSQLLLRRGVSSRLARGIMMGICMTAAGLAFLAASLSHTLIGTVILLAIAISLPAPIFPLCSTLISEVTPPAQRNRAMTFIMSAETLAAIPSSVVTGFLVSDQGLGWPAALILSGVIALVGAGACYFLIHPARAVARLATSSGA